MFCQVLPLHPRVCRVRAAHEGGGQDHQETHWNLTLMRHIHFSIEEGADLEMDDYKHVLFVLCSLAAWLWVP